MNCQQHKISLGALALVALIALTTLAKADQDGASAVARQMRRLEGDGLNANNRLATMRFRRQAHPHKLTVGQLAALNAQQQQQQQQAAVEQQANVEQSLAEADEQTLKRQLPDLIAQAHNDKSVERALLRLVISASLRNANLIREQQQPQNNQWQLDNLDNAQNNLAQYNQANSGSVGEFVPIRLPPTASSSGRLEPSELANLEAQLVANAAELPDLSGVLNGGNLLSSPMDKREYSKPCLFNAISCVRTPFRKLTS